ncbi:4-hydroxyphenylacetate 3-hydroxylase family protein [Paracraurococcus lichenis]|uniref:4-hydroxyphenylacetate 3-hydroxylase N-terminal domain-containing protein n=1 Tax=Paracraurococcus lichenis TaxID=3064888 RepID=A0ABT9E9M1_9PROT|nr:4-hydroxyphenylacetate 3-hydroxylase N-terminal domain-containing protein [Paracraurococcus sp. LOR1-02]MDO9712673.1 4-hydroxyphenylacetate 3-hydroxylase N-terminal domain-containing protein [Paracraurococcus sp. LOR1-02]
MSSSGTGASVKDGAQHIRAVRDGRAVYLDGQLVHDVTTHSAYRNAVASAARMYDHQARPENLERMTFDLGNGRRVSRAWQLPGSYAEMVERRKALVEWAELSCGFLGRSPDHVASSVCGQYMGIEVFEAHDPKRAAAFRDWFEQVRRDDVFLTYVINNVQGDRSKAFGSQGPGAEDMIARIVDEDSGGITIRGAKLFATSAIMANEIFVGSGQPLQRGEEHLAFSCALPMNAKGMKMLSRKSFEATATSEYDNPLSWRFDENDALIFFDDVKVPWERVFHYRSTDMCRAQLHDTPAHVYQNYQAQIRLSVKLRFLVGLARGIAETIGTVNFPPVRETLGKLASQAAVIEGMVLGMEAGGYHRGPYWLPNKHLLYAAQVQSQEMYPQVITAIRELAGGALLMLPSSARDFGNPELERIIDLTQVSPAMSGRDRVKLLKLCWDAVGSEFASRHLQYEMFYAGGQYVTRGHSYRTYDWERATGLAAALTDLYRLEDSVAAPGRAA